MATPTRNPKHLKLKFKPKPIVKLDPLEPIAAEPPAPAAQPKPKKAVMAFLLHVMDNCASAVENGMPNMLTEGYDQDYYETVGATDHESFKSMVQTGWQQLLTEFSLDPKFVPDNVLSLALD